MLQLCKMTAKITRFRYCIQVGWNYSFVLSRQIPFLLLNGNQLSISQLHQCKESGPSLCNIRVQDLLRFCIHHAHKEQSSKRRIVMLENAASTNISVIIIIVGILFMLSRNKEKHLPYLNCNNRCLGFVAILVGAALLLGRFGI